MFFEDFLKKYQKVPVEEYSNIVLKDIPTPIVSCRVSTYMHEPYIKQCLDGVLMQKTDFPFEIVLGEDESSDGTREICIEYAKKHPNKIRLFLHKRENNILRDGNPSATFQSTYSSFHCRGKYQAICEGDDYWTDPYKLQKQVDFLEANPEYGLVHGDCDFYYQDKKILEYKANRNLSNLKENLDSSKLFNGLIDGDYKIRTATALFKKELLSKRVLGEVQFLTGDTPMWLDFSQIIKFKYIDETFAVYRIAKNSASRPLDKTRHYRFKLSMAEMRLYYCKKYNYPINLKLRKRYNSSLLDYKLFMPQYNELYPLFEPNPLQIFKLQTSKIMLCRTFYKFIILIQKYRRYILNKFYLS